MYTNVIFQDNSHQTSVYCLFVNKVLLVTVKPLHNTTAYFKVKVIEI